MSFGGEGLITHSNNIVTYVDDYLKQILHYWSKITKKQCKENLEKFREEFNKKFGGKK